MIFSVIMSAALILLVTVSVVRLICVSGIPDTDNAIHRCLYLQPNSRRGFCVSRSELARVFLLALLFRLVVFLIGILAMSIVTNAEKITLEQIIGAYQKWDVSNYIDIATKGYKARCIDGQYLLLVFFPVYPLLMGLVNLLVRNPLVSGLLVSWLSYAGACTVLMALLAQDYDRRTARTTLVYLSVFPFAIFFGTCMTESVFLLMCALSMYFIRKHKWSAAAVFGFIAALTRITGVMLVFAYFAEWMEHGQIVGKLRNKDWGSVIRYIFTDGIYVLVIPLGVVVYMMINYFVAGDPLIFLEYQKSNWHQETQFFGKTFKMMFDYAANGAKIAYSSFIPQMLIAVLTVLCGFYGLGKHRMMYYGMLLPLFITNVSASWPISGGRYAACVFPVFIILADFAQRHRRAKEWITVIFAILFGMVFTLYFNNKIV